MRLSLNMVDFDRRGFAAADSHDRLHLEGCATAFVDGFNHAARGWKTLHASLADFSDAERGFAYEGAGMYAAIRSLRVGRTRAAAHVLAGSGVRYRHLIHVGWGWASALVGTPLPLPIPPTPVLRWLALDGAGFALGFFGGASRVRKLAQHSGDARRSALIAGAGRSLWFSQCADVARIEAIINACDAPAQADLWCGVGLACTYAGSATEPVSRAELLADRAGAFVTPFRQGVAFGVVAQDVSGCPSDVSRSIAAQVLRRPAADITLLAEQALDRVGADTGVSSYGLWRDSVRAAVAL